FISLILVFKVCLTTSLDRNAKRYPGGSRFPISLKFVRSVPPLGALENIELRPLAFTPQQHPDRPAAAVIRLRRCEREHVSANRPVRAPLGGGLFQDRLAAGRAPPAAVYP